MDKIIPVEPKKRKVVRTSVKLPPELWEVLEDAARVFTQEAKEDGRETFSRDDVIEHACRWWHQEWLAGRDKRRRR